MGQQSSHLMLNLGQHEFRPKMSNI